MFYGPCHSTSATLSLWKGDDEGFFGHGSVLSTEKKCILSGTVPLTDTDLYQSVLIDN